ncbi:2230_t:CDS:2, partial [Gigaspora margarita]
MKEKSVKEQKAQYNSPPSNRPKNVSYVETEYENEAEEQEEIVYATQTQSKPYNKDRKEAKLKQSESQKEKTLCTKTQQYQEPIVVAKEVSMDIKNNPKNETSLAICLVEAMGGIKQNNNVISYNIGHEITGQQKEEANNLLLDNHDVFATDISESRQTMGL